MSLAGCADFLKERQSTTYDGAALVSSEYALEASVFGIHKQIASSGFKSGAFCEWLAPASGLAHWGNTNALTNPLERWTCCLNFTRYSKHPEGYTSFAGLYKAIYLCNSVLDAIGNSKVRESFKQEIIGEVYFLRAMAYFYLVRLYGNVSLYLTAPTSVDDRLYGPRTDFRIVYGLILKDLDRAESLMRDYNEMIAAVRKATESADGGNASGRVCLHAAVACRSLVYLTMGTLMNSSSDNFWTWEVPLMEQWPTDPADGEKIVPWGGITDAAQAFAKAREDSERLIPESASFDSQSPYRLCEDYRQLFRWTEYEDWQLAERIWVMPRAPETNDGGSALTQWALPSNYMGTSAVQTFGRCRPDRWFFQEWCRRKNGVKGKGNDNKEIYVDCGDPRMKVNLIYGSYPGADMAEKTCYPDASRIYSASEDILKRYGLPYYGKYYDPSYDNSVGNSDLYVMRLAEVYLIAAEACAHLGDLNAAVDYVNVLLERARKSTDGAPASEPAAWNVADFNQKTLLEAIFWERCFEMPFEHHEYFDTHRNGAQWIIDNISIPKNEFLERKEQADKDGYSGYRTVYYGKGFTYNKDVASVRKGLVNAYPYDEMVYNTCLNANIHDPFSGQNPEEVYWK